MNNDKELISAIKWASKNHVKKAGKNYTKDYSIIAYTPEILIEEYRKSLKKWTIKVFWNVIS